MKRYANRMNARRDANHGDVASALRAIGVGLIDAAQYGFPCDLIGMLRGDTEFLEIKDGSKPPSERKLTKKGERFAADLERHGKKLHIVNNPAEALAIFGARQTA